MVANSTKDFSVTWQNPSDANLTWIYDTMHFPAPLCELGGEFLDRMYSKFMAARTVYVNGFAFTAGLTPPPPTAEILARGIFDVWTNDYLPIMQEVCQRLRSGDYDSMSLTELGDAAEGLMAEAVDAFGYTMKAITGFMGPTFGFVAFLQAELGDTEGPQLVAALLQGFENGTAAAGAGLSQLAEEAAEHSAVAEALRQGRFDTIEAVEGGAEFMAQLRSYLENYGWRVDSWGFMERPTWAENPRMPLTLISHYINDPDRSPAMAHARASEQREDVVKDVEARLNPDKLPQFRAMLEASQAHVPVSEGRALWQLITIGSLRVPFLALGRKLVAAGALTSSDQVFFFNTAELKQAAHNPTPQLRATADQRQAEFESNKSLTPPPFIGTPPDLSHMPPEMLPLLTLFFGLGQPNVEGRVITGQAASKGVVRARARVITDLSDSERLQPGEVLVCQTTAPPWTPLFAIAAAVVTDSGGVLSHSAICAREYAIPCVVATQVATHVIPDGAMITVDGTKGTVQIEG
jgi:rifampicin phosphotransferase